MKLQELLEEREVFLKKLDEDKKKITFLTETVQQMQVAITTKLRTDADEVKLGKSGAIPKTPFQPQLAPNNPNPRPDPFSMIDLLQCEPIMVKSPVTTMVKFCPPVAKEEIVNSPPPKTGSKLDQRRDDFQSLAHIQCYRCDKYGHKSVDCYSLNRDNSESLAHIQCFLCDKYGHKKADCYSSINRNNSQSLAHVKCYRCEEYGHKKADCYSLSRDRKRKEREERMRSNQCEPLVPYNPRTWDIGRNLMDFSTTMDKICSRLDSIEDRISRPVEIRIVQNRNAMHSRQLK